MSAVSAVSAFSFLRRQHTYIPGVISFCTFYFCEARPSGLRFSPLNASDLEGAEDEK